MRLNILETDLRCPRCHRKLKDEELIEAAILNGLYNSVGVPREPHYICTNPRCPCCREKVKFTEWFGMPRATGKDFFDY